jgi:hypothetical protein
MSSFPISPEEFISIPKTFSKRARRVLSEAHLETEKRDTGSVDMNSLIAGLIAEDQNLESLKLKDDDPVVKKTCGRANGRSGEDSKTEANSNARVRGARMLEITRASFFCASCRRFIVQTKPSSSSTEHRSLFDWDACFARIRACELCGKSPEGQASSEQSRTAASACRDLAGAVRGHNNFTGGRNHRGNGGPDFAGVGGGLESSGFTAP